MKDIAKIRNVVGMARVILTGLLGFSIVRIQYRQIAVDILAVNFDCWPTYFCSDRYCWPVSRGR